MIARDVAAAATGRFDVAVVGGGIHGAACLLEATLRGARAVLVERDDFGGGTSWNSLRIVHGGLRYLQTADLVRFRESVRERAWLAAEFPELVAPLPCLLPLDGRGTRRPAVLRAALAANDFLSRLFAGVGPFPRGRVIAPDAARRACALLPDGPLAGAASWHDGFVPDSQRLIVEMLHWACSGGAVALNRVAAEALESEAGAVRRLVVRDRVAERRVAIPCDRIVLCAGSGGGALAARLDRSAPSLGAPSLAFNVLLDRDPPFDGGLAAPSAGGPDGTSFLVPFKGRTLAGTRHAPLDGEPPAEGPGRDLVERYLSELNAALPGLRVGRRDVLRTFHGLLPVARAGSTDLTRRARVVDHADHGGPRGLVTVEGIKLTTARATTARGLDVALGGRGTRSRGRPRRPAPHHPPDAERFLALVRSRPEDAADVVRRLVAEESALSADDVMLRRTDWGIFPSRAAEIRPLVEAAAARGEP